MIFIDVGSLDLAVMRTRQGNAPPLVVLGRICLGTRVLGIPFKREGLRLWLHRCTRGRGAIPEWQGKDGHADQMRTLLEILQQPAVTGRAMFTGGGRTPKRHLGFWLQIQLPAMLGGKAVTLQPAVIRTQVFGDAQLVSTDRRFHEEFLQGNWVDPALLGNPPYVTGRGIRNADFRYTGAHPYRLWQVWIDTSVPDPVIELEIEYPEYAQYPEDKQAPKRRGYVFRLALSTSSEADQVNTVFDRSLTEENGMVLHKQTTYKLELFVPN